MSNVFEPVQLPVGLVGLDFAVVAVGVAVVVPKIMMILKIVVSRVFLKIS